MARLDLAKLTDWFRDFERVLVLFARQVLGREDQASAEDIVQALFTRLLSQAGSGSVPAAPNPSAWLHRCVRNACLDERRRRFRRRRHESSIAVGRADWFEPQPGDLVDARLAQDILCTLPDLDRQVVSLRIWSGLTLSEIAEVTGQPVSTVHDQYRRALSAVRALIEQDAARCRSRYERASAE